MCEKKSSEAGEEKPKPVIVRNTTDLQRLKLEKLMKNPDKPVLIPERPKEKGVPSVPDFVRNVMGSSAGAGSGEFHVYRHLRRKEYARQKYMKEKAEREKLDDDHHAKLEENKRKAEERTSKKRAKRLKKKEKRKLKQKRPKLEKPSESEDSESSNSDAESSEVKDDKSEASGQQMEDNSSDQCVECKEEIEINTLTTDVKIDRSATEKCELDDENKAAPAVNNSDEKTVIVLDSESKVDVKESESENLENIN